MGDESLDDEVMLDSAESFETAYKSHSGSIYRFLFWRTNDTQLSEDLTSATFEKAWISRKSFKSGSVRAWLYRIARNTLIDHWRKPRDLSIDSLDSAQDEAQADPAEVIDRQIEVDRLEQALKGLPDEMRSVVALRFINGMSCKQVAVKLGLSESNVRVIQHRALKKLRNYLDE